MTQLAASWLSEFRARGRARFEELGFPTVRQEEWRFTNPAPLAVPSTRTGPAQNGSHASPS